MILFFAKMTAWHWLILGLVLMFVEMAAPGAFFLWPGLAAFIVGLVKVVFPGFPWTLALPLWSVLSIAAVLGWLDYRRKNPGPAAQGAPLNNRAAQYVGQVFTLDRPIVNGRGQMKVGDSLWTVIADSDLPAGAKVRVTGVENTALRVTQN